jgi:hypothetical protein
MYNTVPLDVNGSGVIVIRKASRREREKRTARADAARSLAHVGVRVDPAIADRLRASERGLSDEIRERLERTFKYDEVDPVTRELVEGLINIAALLRIDFGVEWHAWPPAMQAFAEAVKERVVAYRLPPGILTGAGAAAEMLRDEPPETIGRMRERDDQRAHPYKHLADAQKRRSSYTGLTTHSKGGISN